MRSTVTSVHTTVCASKTTCSACHCSLVLIFIDDPRARRLLGRPHCIATSFPMSKHFQELNFLRVQFPSCNLFKAEMCRYELNERAWENTRISRVQAPTPSSEGAWTKPSKTWLWGKKHSQQKLQPRRNARKRREQSRWTEETSRIERVSRKSATSFSETTSAKTSKAWTCAGGSRILLRGEEGSHFPHRTIKAFVPVFFFPLSRP